MSEPVTFEELRALSCQDSPAAVRAFCEAHGIRYFRGKYGRPSTTRRALDAALGLAQDEKEPNPIEF